DQCWVISNNNQTSEYLIKILKEIRKYGANLLIITHELKDFHDNVERILEQCSTRVYFRQSHNDIKFIKERKLLSESQAEFLRTSKKGEAIVQINHDFAFTAHYEKDDDADTHHDVVNKILY